MCTAIGDFNGFRLRMENTIPKFQRFLSSRFESSLYGQNYYSLYTITIKKNFGDIPPRPKFFEESDGATRFSIGPRPLGLKNGFLKGILKKLMFKS